MNAFLARRKLHLRPINHISHRVLRVFALLFVVHSGGQSACMILFQWSKILSCMHDIISVHDNKGGGVRRLWTTFGPNLAPEYFFSISWWWGGGLGGSFLLHVCILKMLSISWGIQICMQNMNNFSDLWPSPSR